MTCTVFTGAAEELLAEGDGLVLGEVLGEVLAESDGAAAVLELVLLAV